MVNLLSPNASNDELKKENSPKVIIVVAKVNPVVGGDVGACCLLFNVVRENKQSKRN
jgi:hypothetical protein